MCEIVNLTPKLLKQLKKQEVAYLTSRVVNEHYAEEPWKMMAYGVMLRHTNMVQYERTPGVANYGVEIEYDLRPTDYLTKEELKKCIAAGVRHDLIHAGWGNNFSVEEDGSIPNGFEIVLGPRPLDVVRRTLLMVLNGSSLPTFTNYDSDKVGVHVTVDKYPHEWQKVLFMDVWNHPWLHTIYHRLIGRKPNEFCRLMTKDKKGKYIKDEYGIVKERDNGSLEVRAFRNSGHPGVTMTQVSFVAEIDRIIRQGVNDIDEVFDTLAKDSRFKGIRV